jgi:hypothetical protein
MGRQVPLASSLLLASCILLLKPRADVHAHAFGITDLLCQSLAQHASTAGSVQGFQGPQASCKLRGMLKLLKACVVALVAHAAAIKLSEAHPTSAVHD